MLQLFYLGQLPTFRRLFFFLSPVRAAFAFEAAFFAPFDAAALGGMLRSQMK